VSAEHRSALVQICSTWQYRLLQLAFEMAALVASWYLTVELRLLLNPVMALQLSPADAWRVAPPPAGILLLWMAVIPWLDNYRNRDTSVGRSLRYIAQASLVCSALLIVAAFFGRSLGVGISRGTVLLFAPVSFALLLGARYAALLGAARLGQAWPVHERVAVIGAGQEVHSLVDMLRSVWNGAVTLSGVILPQGASGEGQGNPVPVLGTTRELAAVINRARLNRVILLNEHVARDEAEECSRILRSMDVIVSRALAPAASGARLHLTELYGMRLLDELPYTVGPLLTRQQELLKRAFDVAGAAATLVLLSPVLLFLAIVIRITSPGPAFYRSMRVGKGGRHFTFLKFRSMCDRADQRRNTLSNEQGGHLFKLRDDPRVTPLGRYMRRYSLDELPQLINVLRGEMSLVGPRPLPAEDFDPSGQSSAFAAWSEQRSRVLPGITGLWQTGGRSNLPFEGMMHMDLEYIRNWSLGLDFRILLKTPVTVITGNGAH
jgi:exopolysaccharide biosynthesis polyprenyl glycosylphosphotransferase